jgi:hypothetical protein
MSDLSDKLHALRWRLSRAAKKVSDAEIEIDGALYDVVGLGGGTAGTASLPAVPVQRAPSVGDDHELLRPLAATPVDSVVIVSVL